MCALYALLAALISGCGDDELTPLTEEQMCDEVRGLLAFQALGCTGDQDAAARFGDALYSQYMCTGELRPVLAACLKQAKGFGCGVMTALVEDASYLYWADACLTLPNPAAQQTTCAAAYAAFVDGAFTYLTRALFAVPDQDREQATRHISGYISALERHRPQWWPCAGTMALPDAEACVRAQQALPSGLSSGGVASAAAVVTSALGRSPEVQACAGLFPAAPIARTYTDTQLIYDLIAATLPLVDIASPSERASGDALLNWFTATYAPLAVADSGASGIDRDAAACFQGLSEALSQPAAIASVEAFAQAFLRTTCHGRLLAPR
jgi:hypothetical protein